MIPASGRLPVEQRQHALVSALGFVVGALLAVQIALMDLGLIGTVAVAGVGASLLLVAWRPELGILMTLALFSDALYFGTYGVHLPMLPMGQLVVHDLLFAGWWSVALFAALRRPAGGVSGSRVVGAIAISYAGLLVFFAVYTWLVFPAQMQELLRGARPFLYLTLMVPLMFWLRGRGAIEALLKAAVVVSLGAVALQFYVYFADVNVEPYGLFYEWQVWRSSFEGFDRSSQPFYGLNLIMVGSFVTLAACDRSRLRRQGWSAAVALLLASALISFGRGYWGAIVLAALVAVAAAGRAHRRTSIAGLLLLAALAAAAVRAPSGKGGLDPSGFFVAVFERGALGASSLRNLDGTLGDRYDRVNLAVIREHPILGLGFFLGLGSAAEVDLADTGHNLYADLLLRMGIVGLAAFGILLAVFCWRCRLALRLALPPMHRAAVVGCLGAAAGNLVWGMSSSHMTCRRGMLEMALMIAVVEAVIGRAAPSAPEVSP